MAEQMQWQLCLLWMHDAECRAAEDGSRQHLFQEENRTLR